MLIKKSFFYTLIVAFLFLSFSSFSSENDKVLMAKKSVLNIVNVMYKNNKIVGIGTGSGFIVDSKGYILTNHHVIDKKNGLEQKLLVVDGNSTAEENLKKARLIWLSKKQDIAIIKVDDLSSRPSVKFSKQTPSVGDHLSAIGYPGVTASHRLAEEMVEAVVTDGSLSVVIPRGVNGIETKVLQHSVPVNPGNSGGPLINDCGDVVGINTQAISSDGGRLIQGTFYASDSSASIKALELNNILYERASSVCKTAMTQATDKSNIGLIASILGIVIAIIAIVFSVRTSREKVLHTVSETYTQYIRRTGSKDKSKVNLEEPVTRTAPISPVNEKTWTLSGQVETTKEPLELELTESELRKGITLGRSRQLCDYSIPESKLSRRHIRVSYQEKGILIEDLNSSHGTYINKYRVKPSKPQQLNTGDTLNLARIITFTLS